MANNNVMDEIETINSIPLCDKKARNQMEEILADLDDKVNTGHNHDNEYMSREEVENTFVTKAYVDTQINNITANLDLSKYVLKTELNSKKYMTQADADNKYATEKYVDDEANKIKQYVDGELPKYAKIEDVEDLYTFARQLEIRLNNLEAGQTAIMNEINKIKKELGIS